MTHISDPKLIEADIERDRAEFAATLEALQDRVSVDALAQDALGLLRTNSASYIRSVDAAIRGNPLAVALVGAGLAWLVFGNRKPVEKPKAKLEALLAWEDDGGPARPPDEPEPAWTNASDGLRLKATEALRKLEADARLAGADIRDFAQERAAVLAEFVDGLRQSFDHGLDGLSQTARDKLVDAREAAYAARLRAERMARSSSREAGRMIEDHPMIAAAGVLALGAALGAALPRGDYKTPRAERDRLMRHAAQLLADERALVGRIAEDIAATAKSRTDIAADPVDQASDTGNENGGQVAKAS